MVLFAQFPDTAIVRTFGGKSMDVGKDVQYTSDHGFIIAGTTSSFGSGNTAIYLIKVDSNCNYQWSKALGGIGIEWGYSVKQTFDGGYAVAGYTNSFGNGGYDMYLVKTDSVGNIIWEKTYGGNDWDFGYCVQQTPDSGFVMCGETYSYGHGMSDAYIVKTNKMGDTLWTRTMGGTNVDAAYSIALLNDSTYIVVGETSSFGIGGSEIYFISLDKNGNQIKTKTFGTTMNDKANWIEKLSDGGMAIVGETNSDTLTTPGDTTQKEMILKLSSLSSNDTLEWIRVYANSNNGADVCNAVREKNNGELITCGSSNPSGSGGSGMKMMMLNSDGWWLSGPAFGGANDEEGYALVITPKKEVVFVGSTTSYGQGLQDVYLVKLKKDSIVMNYTLDLQQFNDTFLSPLAVQEYQAAKNVLIYPNPFIESTMLVIENWKQLYINSAEFKITDLIGRELYTSEIKNQQTIIRRGNLNAGVYFFTITTLGKIVCEGKFVIQ